MKGNINWLQRLCKWRTIFAGWQLGTRPDTDAECAAVRDHREVTMLMRAELNALLGLLIEKKVFTAGEFTEALQQEARLLDQAYANKFPGMYSTDRGIQLELPRAHETMKRMNFKP